MMIVHEVEKGQLTYKQAQEKYGIQGKTTVLTWLRKHGQQDWTCKTMQNHLSVSSLHSKEFVN
jgi:transposase